MRPNGMSSPVNDLSSLTDFDRKSRLAGSLGAQLRTLRARARAHTGGAGRARWAGPGHAQGAGARPAPRPHPQTLTRLADALALTAAERATLLASAEAPSHERPAVPSHEPPAVRRHPQLPMWWTSFVGREAEVETVRALLDPVGSSVRLLTLLGPGGIGKTRLAVKVALDLAAAYPDGVIFVDLAPLTDPRLVPTTIAHALDVREDRGRSPRELLLESLRPRGLLLILDNFEHLLGAAPQLAEILQECPRIRLLVTSRTALQLSAERRLRIRSLPTPGDGVAAPQDVEALPAVRLFVERAQAVVSGFHLDANNATDVAAVCRRLDGMPLAIELAAARIGLLPPAALLRRLDLRLPLLTAGAPDLPERQQTLRKTLAWSYNLLEPKTQVLFRRLAVFVGGWTLDAAEDVCADIQLPTADVLDGLQVLLDSSLVRVDDTGDPSRFGMLETMREYAREQLVSSGELEQLRAAHATYYSRLGEPMAAARTIAPSIAGTSTTLTAEAIEQLEAEFANLQAALDWWLTDGRPAEGLRLAVAFHALSSRLGQYALGRRWLETMLELADRTAPASAFRLGERAVALTEAGTLPATRATTNKRGNSIVAASKPGVSLTKPRDWQSRLPTSVWRSG